jgi:hypothetical protein
MVEGGIRRFITLILSVRDRIDEIGSLHRYYHQYRSADDVSEFKDFDEGDLLHLLVNKGGRRQSNSAWPVQEY